jgi:hypothetical protein
MLEELDAPIRRIEVAMTTMYDELQGIPNSTYCSVRQFLMLCL